MNHPRQNPFYLLFVTVAAVLAPPTLAAEPATITPEQFQAPPLTSKSRPLWFWNKANPTTAEIQEQIDELQELLHAYREGLIKVKQSQWMKELRSFAKQWDRNIKQQGFMEVFERQYGVANGATTEGTVTRQGDGPQGQ